MQLRAGEGVVYVVTTYMNSLSRPQLHTKTLSVGAGEGRGEGDPVCNEAKFIILAVAPNQQNFFRHDHSMLSTVEFFHHPQSSLVEANHKQFCLR